MINLIHAELFELRKSKTFFISLLISIICASALAMVGIKTADGSMSVGTQISGLSDILIFSVVLPLMIGVIVCHDFESKLIHDAICCGRNSIVISKILVYLGITAIIALPYAIAALLVYTNSGAVDSPAMVASGYFEIMKYPIGQSTDSQGTGKVIAVLFAIMLSYAARFSVCIPLAFKIRKAVVVTVIGVIFSFLIDVIMSAMTQTAGLDKIAEFLPFSNVLLSVECTSTQLTRAIIVDIVFLILIGWLTCRMFKHSEIK